MASAVIGQGVGLVAWPVSLLIVKHARLLEWENSIDSTVSVHLPSLLVFSRSRRSVAMRPSQCCFLLRCVSAEVFTHLVPEVTYLSDIPRGVFLGGVRQHFAVCFILVIDVRGGWCWQGLGCHVGDSAKVRPVGLAEIPSQDRLFLCRLDQRWRCDQRRVVL